MATPDVHEEQLRNPLYRDWVKAGLALKYFKEGIECFIDDRVQDQQRKILNEIRQQTGRPDASCDQCEVHEIRPHHKSSTCIFGKKCHCRDSRRRPCPNDVCGRFFDKIVEQHMYGSPSFRNTDASKWCSDYWELAKCFLDKAGYAEKMSAADTDCKGLLTIITNNMFVQMSLDTPIDKDQPDVFSKCKSARNEILHQATLQITEEQLTAYIDTMTEALEDKDKLKEDAHAKKAIQKLKQLKDRKLSVSAFDAFEVRREALKAIEEKRQEVLEIIEEKKQDAIEAIEETLEVERLTTQYNKIKETLDNVTSSMSTNIQDLRNRQDGLEESVDDVKGVQQDFDRKLAELESSEKILKLRDLVLEKRADFKTDLVAFYRQTHSTLPLAPLVEENDAPVVDFYVKPSFKLTDHVTDGNSDESQIGSEIFHSYRDIFFKGTQQCKNIYITSPAGMGKTAFVKHLVMTWCHAHQPLKNDEKHFEEYRDDVELMKSFEFIFLLALRDAPEQECDVDAMIQNQIIADLAYSHFYEQSFLKEILAKEACLIVLDGLDEWSHPVTKSLTCRCRRNQSIPYQIVRANCVVLTTTRPWKLTKANISNASIDRHMEMTQLSDSSFDKLTNDALVYLNGEYCKNKQSEDFKKKICETELDNLERIPLILMQLLCLWFDDEVFGSSLCEIFANMLELLIRRVGKKYPLGKDDLGCAESDLLPSCFTGNFGCYKNLPLLRALGAMCFNGLVADIEHPNLMFSNDVLSNYLSHEEQMFCFKAGILTQSKSCAKVSARQSKTCLAHKTYQEFLAALYISSSKVEAKMLTEQLFAVCSSVEDMLDMWLFFKFIYGLCPEDTCIGISNAIDSIVERTQQFQMYRTSLKDAFILDMGQRSVPSVFIFLMAECAEERKVNNLDIKTIPLKDFFITHCDRIMNMIIELIKSKEYCIKTISWVTQTFIDSVDVNKIHSVQNLALENGVNEDSVRTIISNSLDTINTIEMPASYFGVVFDTLKKVEHLQALHLHRQTLTRGDLLQMYCWISQSTALKQIELQYLNYGDHGSSNRSTCGDLLLDLSRHEMLQYLRLVSLEVDEVRIGTVAVETCSLQGLNSVFIENHKLATNPKIVELRKVNYGVAVSILKLASNYNDIESLEMHGGKGINKSTHELFISSSTTSVRSLRDDIIRSELDVDLYLSLCKIIGP